MTTTTGKPIPVHVVMVLDESGSMSRLRADLIGGVNKFLADQRAEEGKCRLTLVKFAPYTVLHNAVKIADVPDLTAADYEPHSMTPLLDTEGRAIHEAMARAEARKAAGKREEAVLFVTYTDGAENASREYTFESLAALKEAREADGWTFLYLGAGHDAYGQSSAMGTRVANTSSSTASAKGMSDVFANVSNVTRGYRGAANAGDRATLVAASAAAYSTFGLDKLEDAAPTVTTTTTTTTAQRPARPPRRRATR